MIRYFRNESSDKVKITLDFKVLKSDWDKKAHLFTTGVTDNFVAPDPTDPTKVTIKGELKPGQEYGWILAYDHKGPIEGGIKLGYF